MGDWDITDDEIQALVAVQRGGEHVTLPDDLVASIHERYRSKADGEPIELTPDEAWAAMGPAAREGTPREDIKPGLTGTIMGSIPVVVVAERSDAAP